MWLGHYNPGVCYSSCRGWNGTKDVEAGIWVYRNIKPRRSESGQNDRASSLLLGVDYVMASLDSSIQKHERDSLASQSGHNIDRFQCQSVHVPQALALDTEQIAPRSRYGKPRTRQRGFSFAYLSNDL